MEEKKIGGFSSLWLRNETFIFNLGAPHEEA